MKQHTASNENYGSAFVNNPSEHVPTKTQRLIGGIPPIKEPQLPPGRAASLMTCTVTRRAYWIVFKRFGSNWIWEKNITAIPLPRSQQKSKVDIVVTTDARLPDLNMGGEDWGHWSCPGCGEKQERRGNHYVHLATCRCGIDCCRGDQTQYRQPPICPNCNHPLHTVGHTTQKLSGVTSGHLDLGNSRMLPGADRAELENGANKTEKTQIQRRKK